MADLLLAQIAAGVAGGIIITVFLLFILFVVLIGVATRYKKCPSDQVLVIYGKTRGDKAARCIHGGAAFVIPVIQDYAFLSLQPMQIDVGLTNALCNQNIRINVPSVFTVGISTDEALMGNAANRLLGLTQDEIANLAKDIIFGQLRLVIASMTIEQINADRETFLRNIEQNVAEELNKLGLQLLNVNITDITDESGYIDAIGRRAAAEAVNKARVDVAEEERKGGIGEAEARKVQRIAVSEAEAIAQSGEAAADRDRRIAIKKAEAEALTGEAAADRDRRIAVKQAEAEALTGEAAADRDRRIAVKQAEAEALTGEAAADRDRRIAVKQADAAAIEGENLSAIEIAKSNAQRVEQEAEAYRLAEVAKRVAEAKIKQADFEAETTAQVARAKMEMERQKAEDIVKTEIEKEQTVIRAEAEAEKMRREAKGQADAIFMKLEAEAKGNFEILKAQGEGFNQIVSACGNNADAAAKMLIIEKLEQLVQMQAEAIKGIKIDKVTVWDGGKSADGKTATSNFLSGMVKSLPPLHDIANMAGLDLPAYLGKVEEKKAESEAELPETPVKESAEK